MESLKDKAISILIENKGKTSDFLNISSYDDLFETLSSFVLLERFDDAKKVLDYICKYQTKKGDFQFKRLVKSGNFDAGRKNPIIFLKVLNEYFQKVNNKKEVARFSKEIKRALSYLDDSFDKNFILFYEFDKLGLKKFSAYDNTLFLSFAEEFSDILNEYNLNKEADKIYIFKTKVELGCQRYFFNRDEKVIIEWFKPEVFKYKIAKDVKLPQIFLNYDFNNISIEKEVLKHIKVDIKNETNFEYILLILLYLKLKKDKDYLKLYENYKKYMFYFPKKLVSEKNYNAKIKKSLFVEFKEDVKKFEKEKMIIISLNQLKIANLVLRLEL